MAVVTTSADFFCPTPVPVFDKAAAEFAGTVAMAWRSLPAPQAAIPWNAPLEGENAPAVITPKC